MYISHLHLSMQIIIIYTTDMYLYVGTRLWHTVSINVISQFICVKRTNVYLILVTQPPALWAIFSTIFRGKFVSCILVLLQCFPAFVQKEPITVEGG